ncbi:MAG: alpha/beta hydrolase-fold protein [Gemmatimonadaceae bacterium]
MHERHARALPLTAILSLCATLLPAQQPHGWPTGRAKVKFEVEIPASVRSEATTGRAFVMLARTNTTEPRFQIGRIGVPMFGRDFVQVGPGGVATVDGTDLGHPVWDLADIPAGEYWIQAMVSVYSEFRRADGKVVWMHDDQWEGQQWTRSPGNLYSTPRQVRLDPTKPSVIRLVADQKIPPIQMPANTAWVERFRFESPSLTRFWGRPVYLGATVLLPKDYKTATGSYPILYEQGHFSTGNPLRFEEGAELHREWVKDNFPRILVVTFQHPNPYFDDSYVVNSVNVGPYGDAVMQELIPEVEKRYRVIREPWARWLHGGSTGGWEALALQLFNPDFFGGTWAYCPDPVTFTDVEGINIYKDDNAFHKQITEWHRTPTINSREINGEVRQTSQQRNWMELVNGTKGRSGHQLDIWSAAYGPLGDDGYFKPVFDKKTGKVDHVVAEYWRENYDLLHYLRKNWHTVGPKLVGKLHIYTGDADTYFLDRATRELEAWMKTTQNPHDEGLFMYGDQKPHCWSGPVTQAERLKEMAQHGLRHMPAGTTTPWWKY